MIPVQTTIPSVTQDDEPQPPTDSSGLVIGIIVSFAVLGGILLVAISSCVICRLVAIVLCILAYISDEW